jgi:hypothetical protein
MKSARFSFEMAVDGFTGEGARFPRGKPRTKSSPRSRYALTGRAVPCIADPYLL